MQGRATKLNNYSLLLPDVLIFLYLIYDLLAVLGRLSKMLQRNGATIDTILRSLESTKTELSKLGKPETVRRNINSVPARTEQESNQQGLGPFPICHSGDTSESSDSESDLSSSEDDGSDSEDNDSDKGTVPGPQNVLLHRGQQLKKPARSLSETCFLVQRKFQDLVQTILQHITARFASFETDAVLASFRVFSPSTWPRDNLDFGDAEIEHLSQHFSVPLTQQGFSPALCRLEWGELKLLVRDFIQQIRQLIL